MSLQSEMPVQRITLYKNNLGFVERHASVPAGSTTSMLVPAELKQLVESTLSVNGNGKPVVVTYGSKQSEEAPEPMRYPFQYGSATNMGAFLASLSGAEVELRTRDGSVSGRVLLVEKERVAIPESDQVEERYTSTTILTDDGEIRSFPLVGVVGLSIRDAKLQAELVATLQATVARRYPKKPRKAVPADKLQVTFQPQDADEEEAGDTDLHVSYLDRAKEWRYVAATVRARVVGSVYVRASPCNVQA